MAIQIGDVLTQEELNRLGVIKRCTFGYNNTNFVYRNGNIGYVLKLRDGGMEVLEKYNIQDL